MEICDKNNCAGCFACYNACAVGAITMQEDTIGHIYPNVNDALCINCGLCKKVCPVNMPIAQVEPEKVYASWALDETARLASTSGGLAHHFAKKMIEAGGIVYGCSSYLQNEQVAHIRCENLEQIEALKGSKYVQSFILDTYTQCKQDLLAGRNVLFIGLPCQIAGLKSFLRKEYAQLITIDLICHGVPPQKLLLEHLEKIGIKPYKVSFREPEGYYLTVENKEGERKRIHSFDDLYYVAFHSQLCYRESCYQCPYAKPERVSDITLGDFWSLGKEVPFVHSQKNGVSVCMVNTNKGNEFLSSCEGLFLEERTLTEAVKGNHNLRQPSKSHKNREKFLKIYSKKGFDKATKSILRKTIFKYKVLKLLQKNNFIMSILSKLRGKTGKKKEK